MITADTPILPHTIHTIPRTLRYVEHLQRIYNFRAQPTKNDTSQLHRENVTGLLLTGLST
jgi:hypothetical protein